MSEPTHPSLAGFTHPKENKSTPDVIMAAAQRIISRGKARDGALVATSSTSPPPTTVTTDFMSLLEDVLAKEIEEAKKAEEAQ
jgi:hypothetical protein